MIISFRNEEEYKRWLAWQSWKVREKAKKFAETFPNTIPVVLVLEVDSCQNCDSGSAHVFIHPLYCNELAKWIVE
jgi:hypothetical protein